MTISDTIQIQVSHPTGHYPIYVGYGLLGYLREFVGAEMSFVVITDSHVGPLYAHHMPDALAVLTLTAGESHKTLRTAGRLYSQLLAAGLDRSGAIVALGGGVVNDLAGFVAATYLRGVRFIPCPTSLVAMVDASIGGKTGVDLPIGKNLVGAFKQPELVLADVDTLNTLPEEEYAAGMAEIVKHGLIGDESILHRLETGDWGLVSEDWGLKDRDRLLTRQTLMERIHGLIVDAIRVKQAVVQEDPLEQGRRAVLNLGHTFAHAMEQVSGYQVRHGFAVAMGLVAATRVSAEMQLCPPALVERVENLLARLSLPTRIPGNLAPDDLLAAMQVDKKRERGRLRFVLLRDVGDVLITSDVPPDLVRNALTALATGAPVAAPPSSPGPTSFTQLSRRIALALRQAPGRYGLTLDDEGWVPLTDLLAAMQRRRDVWQNLTDNELQHLLATTDKQRFEIKDGRIRLPHSDSPTEEQPEEPDEPLE